MKIRNLMCAFALAVALPMGATDLVIVPLTGAEESTAIDKIGSWKFEGETAMVLYGTDGKTVLAKRNLSEVRKIVFKEGKVSFEDPKATSFTVYPNPTEDELTVGGADENTSLRVIDLQGRILRSAQGTKVSVESLPAGVYNLLVDGKVFRFIKK